ncbi:UNVERIFIED_CONTAM: hypothetical protein Slati_1157500 [Sesamum latifolium]|uniref:Uncharacterized protein n=1 Tax=Sesamum latifolium TaxID=2727402 RepID=A0AAW2XD95_9LAMI
MPRASMMGKAEVNDPPRKGIIWMIAGGPAGGDSQRARKTQVREAYETKMKEIMNMEPTNDVPLIQFDQKEQNGAGIPGNDALVITALLANYEIERVFIDSGSSADILFGEAYDQMQLGDVPLEAVDTSLYDFAGEVVHPRGMILLPLTLGTSPLKKTCLLKFLVVDIPSAYNVILGCPTLNAFRAIYILSHRDLGASQQSTKSWLLLAHYETRRTSLGEQVREMPKTCNTLIHQPAEPLNAIAMSFLSMGMDIVGPFHWHWAKEIFLCCHRLLHKVGRQTPRITEGEVMKFI